MTEIPTKLIDITAEQARSFLLDNQRYSNAELPKYFNFNAVLTEVQDLIGETAIDDCLKTNTDLSSVNHILVSSKDGAYAIRPLSLSHPVLYYLLVRELTSSKT